ncbi:hypothetical protein K7432_006634 [Basidiobolus ranarum]|uniref:alanine--glyoxylate transaminase n=1 Tax=Basidiobolus ranarum TaxID=34480 RepID=A0ABR2WUN0_9FUNG
MTVDHKLCMIPGPIEFHEDVLNAMATPACSHVDPTFIPIFGECIELVRKAFLSSGQPFIICGSGTLGWDMTAANLVEAGEEVLVCNTGYFGDRFGECFETYGAKVTHVRCPIGNATAVEDVAKALESKTYKLVSITQVDTSTGVLNRVQEITKLVKEKSPNTLVAVDGVCSLGAEEFRMDEWGVDVALTASQKALGVPPGLAVMAASKQAIEVFKNRNTPVPNYYANWTRWLPIMNAYESRKPAYFATPAVQLVKALHVALKQLTGRGMDNVFQAHRDTSKKFKDTLESWGLKLVPTSRDVAANTMTAVYYPKGITATDLLPKISAHGVVAAGGLHVEIAPTYFRLGHMSISVLEAERGHMETTLKAVENALKENNYPF